MTRLNFVFLQLHYRYDYNVNIKGTNTSAAVTIDTERARMANYIQSDVRRFLSICSTENAFQYIFTDCC